MAANRFTAGLFDLLWASFACAISALLAASVMEAICWSFKATAAGSNGAAGGAGVAGVLLKFAAPPSTSVSCAGFEDGSALGAASLAGVSGAFWSPPH